MTTRRPKPHYVFYGVIVLIVIVLIGTVVWIRYQTEEHITPYFKTLECTEMEKEQLCYLTYTLRNDSNHQVLTDLNGINGPGFAETHESKIRAVLDDGADVAIFAGSDMEYDSRIDPNETVELTDRFTIPTGRMVESIKIFDTVFPIKP